MTDEARAYAQLLAQLGTEIAPGGDEDFVKIADDLAVSRMLPDGQAALLVGLTGYISQLQGHIDVLLDNCSKASELLQSGKSVEALQMLLKSAGKYEGTRGLRYTGPSSLKSLTPPGDGNSI